MNIPLVFIFLVINPEGLLWVMVFLILPFLFTDLDLVILPNFVVVVVLVRPVTLL